MSQVQSICPGSLHESKNGYSSATLRLLFNGKKVSPYLNNINVNDLRLIIEKTYPICAISGVNIKIPMTLVKNKLQISNPGDYSNYFLKLPPDPTLYLNASEMPANEHLTMQIASQVFKIKTAPCCLVFFSNDSLALLVKRFDRDFSHNMYSVEDFATLGGFSMASHGENYRFLGSYEDMKGDIEKYISASSIELEKFFKIVIFNFLFSNSNGHLKNFSILETADGDFILSPMYDLLNTELHFKTSFIFGLENGLFLEQDQSNNRIIGENKHFLEWGLKLGLQKKRIKDVIDEFQKPHTEIFKLIQNSFLSNATKQNYSNSYLSRLKIFNQDEL